MSRGYTLIEVMAALAILGLGSAGVVAMQKATQLANHNARMIATANQVSLTWLERLRADGLQWNKPAGADDLGDTSWLSAVESANSGKFVRPLAVANTASGVADIHGDDVFPDTDKGAFCTQVMVFPLYNAAGADVTTPAVGVTVRTLWARTGRLIDCTTLPVVAPDASLYGSVYLTSAILNNALPGG